jgi:hypothetical protein
MVTILPTPELCTPAPEIYRANELPSGSACCRTHNLDYAPWAIPAPKWGFFLLPDRAVLARKQELSVGAGRIVQVVEAE